MAVNYVMYIIANKGAGMSPGKLAAQVGHAVQKAYEITDGSRHTRNQPEIIADYNRTGHAKIVLEARDAEHLLTAERYLNERGLRTALIVDEGRTEVPPLTPTALGVEILDKNDPDVVFSMSTFKTYKEDPLPPPLSEMTAMDNRNVEPVLFERLMAKLFGPGWAKK